MPTSKDRARAAINAMMEIGFEQSKIVAVLKGLLNLYGNKWQFIEENNYQNFVEAILAAEEPENNEAAYVGQSDKKRHDMMDGPANTVERLDRGTPSQKRVQYLPCTSSEEAFPKKPKREIDLSIGHNCPNSEEISTGLIGAPVQGLSRHPNVPNATAFFYRQVREAGENVAKATRLDNADCSSSRFSDHNVAGSHKQIQIRHRVSSASGHSNCTGIHKVGVHSINESTSVPAVDEISSLQVSTGIPHDFGDICNGCERVKVLIASGSSRTLHRPAFNYITESTVSENASVNFTLANIRKEDCCTNCYSDCLSASLQCECAQQTVGEFAYTSEGLLTKKFIDDYLSMDRFPVRHPIRTYRSFVLGRSLRECSSHYSMDRNVKSIKECCRNCSCGMQCGNRIMQRGISANLQVFLAADGRRWGLQTVDKLERGAFVCEYVGEILTSSEVNKRMSDSSRNTRSTYPVPLHAKWGLKAKSKDEEACWLDAESYGNVARFVSHRCNDANLVQIPVELEASNRYYHVALFTNRIVDAFEELTLDYGLEFQNQEQEEVFRCLCGSKYCRDAIHRDPKRTRTLQISKKVASKRAINISRKTGFLVMPYNAASKNEVDNLILEHARDEKLNRNELLFQAGSYSIAREDFLIIRPNSWFSCCTIDVACLIITREQRDRLCIPWQCSQTMGLNQMHDDEAANVINVTFKNFLEIEPRLDIPWETINHVFFPFWDEASDHFVVFSFTLGLKGGNSFVLLDSLPSRKSRVVAEHIVNAGLKFREILKNYIRKFQQKEVDFRNFGCGGADAGGMRTSYYSEHATLGW